MYEPPRPARRLGPVLIAVLVVLAGGVGTGAYVMVKQVLNGSGQPSSAAGPGRTTTAAAPPAGNPAASQTSLPAPTGEACPAFTAAAVKAVGRPGSLKLALYVDAKLSGTTGAEAWICQDSDGSLYYQGHSKSGVATNATSDNTILVGAGIRGTVVATGAGYTATNPSTNGDTRYIVSRELLTVIVPSGDRQDYEVTRSLPA